MLLKDISDVEKRIIALQKEKRKMLVDYAQEHAPHAVGDVVKIVGWSYRGKMMKVAKITLVDSYWRSEYHWFVQGYVMNKDGKVGKNHTDFHLQVSEVGRDPA